VERVRAVRTSRNERDCRAAIEGVETAARGSANLVPPVVAAVEARATLGEIADAMRRVFGEYRDTSALGGT
jgi:methylmalonyl-CoA mutase N-terminal domain/subunit